MDAARIPLHNFWTEKGKQMRAELRIADLDAFANPSSPPLTSLQAFWTFNGEPVSGLALLDIDQLERLHEAIGARVAELTEKG